MVCRGLQDCMSLCPAERRFSRALLRAVLLADSGGLQGYVVYIALTEVDRPLEPNTFYITFFMLLHFLFYENFFRDMVIGKNIY